MRVIHASRAREQWSELIGRVHLAGERFVVIRNGKEVAAIVPHDELAVLERLVDDVDVALARHMVNRSRGHARVPWESMRRFAEVEP